MKSNVLFIRLVVRPDEELGKRIKANLRYGESMASAVRAAVDAALWPQRPLMITRSTTSFAVTVTAEQLTAARRGADDRGVSVTAWATSVLREYVESGAFERRTRT